MKYEVMPLVSKWWTKTGTRNPQLQLVPADPAATSWSWSCAVSDKFKLTNNRGVAALLHSLIHN